jgi:hypothetical protein
MLQLQARARTLTVALYKCPGTLKIRTALGQRLPNRFEDTIFLILKFKRFWSKTLLLSSASLRLSDMHSWSPLADTLWPIFRENVIPP